MSVEWMVVALALALSVLSPALAAADPGEIVARFRVGGELHAIELSRLERFQQVQPDADPRALLDQLIEFELLAAAAEARGLGERPAVHEAVEQVAVRLFLEEHFETAWPASAIPKPLLERAYRINAGHFRRPELREASHVVLTTEAGSRPEGALDAQAQALTARIHSDLIAQPPADVEDFHRRASAFGAQAEALGLTLRVESLGRFALQGRFDAAFTEVAFELRAPGELSDPFATRFGWHIIRNEAVHPARDIELDDALPELRSRVLPQFRARQLERLVAKLAERFGATKNVDPLSQGEVLAR